MKLAGYTYLIEELGLSMPPLGLELAVGDKTVDEIKSYGLTKIKLLGKNRKVGSTIYEHIETAINYQGIRLAYLVPIFKALNPDDLATYIQEKPRSINRRCIWFLYEWLIEKKLDIPDSKATYAPLLDEDYYFTLDNGEKNSRTRIVNNMLGNKDFCPMIRKTKKIKEYANKDLMAEAQEELKQIHGIVDTELLGRSIEYLYTKETKSSTEIEKEDTADDKMRKFYRVLKTSGTITLSKNRLINIQNDIVRSNKKDHNYRSEEIYVGETRTTWLSGFEEHIHYIGPKVDQVSKLMSGLLDMHKSLLLDNTLPAMMHAAIVSFGFVYIHPFSDGNGRIHRYLIHDILKSRTKTEQDFIIPVSATILKKADQYDQVLESVSKPIMALIEYDMNEENHSITINNNIEHLYKYLDLTPHVEFLYEMMKASISQDLIHEVLYIVKYDAIKKAIEQLYDIPNKDLNLLIQLVIQNKGKVGSNKRKRFYNWINEKDLLSIEEVVNKILKDIDSNNQRID